jgi:hypothetical protein
LDRLEFREEAMASQVKPASVVPDCSRDSANHVVAFKDSDSGIGPLREHVRGGESSWTCPDHDNIVARTNLSDDAGLRIGVAHVPGG